MKRVCRRFLISGRVQGVWFRAWTQKQAHALAITGYANNLDDGRVEVLACGREEDVAQLQQRLWSGPPAAEVKDIQAETVSYQAASGFLIG